MELDIWLGANVTSLKQNSASEGQGWSIEIKRGDGSTRAFKPRHVVFAHGGNADRVELHPRGIADGHEESTRGVRFETVAVEPAVAFEGLEVEEVGTDLVVLREVVQGEDFGGLDNVLRVGCVPVGGCRCRRGGSRNEGREVVYDEPFGVRALQNDGVRRYEALNVAL